ncbi:hypothetical protein J6590_019041 [Homalodisca vitripennis]|nr:hypothetical protein J6590_019041 [Homalodisca vitripennis]
MTCWYSNGAVIVPSVLPPDTLDNYRRRVLALANGFSLDKVLALPPDILGNYWAKVLTLANGFSLDTVLVLPPDTLDNYWPRVLTLANGFSLDTEPVLPPDILDNYRRRVLALANGFSLDTGLDVFGLAITSEILELFASTATLVSETAVSGVLMHTRHAIFSQGGRPHTLTVLTPAPRRKFTMARGRGWPQRNILKYSYTSPSQRNKLKRSCLTMLSCRPARRAVLSASTLSRQHHCSAKAISQHLRTLDQNGSAARDPHGIKQITVGPPHGIKQITMFIRENVECLDSSFTTTTTISVTIILVNFLCSECELLFSCRPYLVIVAVTAMWTDVEIYIYRPCFHATMGTNNVHSVVDLLCVYAGDTTLLFGGPIPHIDQLCCRAPTPSMMELIMRTARHGLSSDVLVLLYKSLALQLFEYASVVWSPHQLGLIDRLQSVQNKFLRYLDWRESLIGI